MALVTEEESPLFYQIDSSSSGHRLGRISLWAQSKAGKYVFLPASHPRSLNMTEKQILSARKSIHSSPHIHQDWVCQQGRISLAGTLLDVLVVRKRNFDTKRWTLVALGSGQFYETKFLFGEDLRNLLNLLDTHAVLFNYPGVGLSQGFPIKQAMVDAHLAMISLVEDQNRGLGAEEIIFYGHSIGGGVQAEALLHHTFLPHIAYVAVKSRTFSSLSEVAADKTRKHWLKKMLAKQTVRSLDWEMRTARSSLLLSIPEIVLQTAFVRQYQELDSLEKIADDNVISPQVSLAWSLLQAPKSRRKSKILVGVPENHNGDFTDEATLALLIQNSLGKAL
ncbi:MAG: hypothetical protein AAGI90_05700 [Chlamydiota bacterium]